MLRDLFFGIRWIGPRLVVLFFIVPAVFAFWFLSVEPGVLVWLSFLRLIVTLVGIAFPCFSVIGRGVSLFPPALFFACWGRDPGSKD